MSTVTERKEQRANDRKRRVPLGVPRPKLSFPIPPELDRGYVLRWINDVPGRLHAAEEGGWEYVLEGELKGATDNADLGEKESKPVGKNENGTPLIAYLMKLKREWYNEDQAAKRKEIDQVDAAIKRGTFNENPDDKRYIPREGISIDDNRR